jgi:hypothetical protein
MEEHGLRTFKKWVRRKIFGPRSDEITEKWRRLHNEELYNVHSSLNIIRVNNSRRMRCAWHVAWVERGEVRTAFWRKSLRQRDHFQDLSIDGRTILKWILRKWGGGVDCIDVAAGLVQMAGYRMCGKERSVSHEMRAISILYENWLAPREGICSVELLLLLLLSLSSSSSFPLSYL